MSQNSQQPEEKKSHRGLIIGIVVVVIVVVVLIVCGVCLGGDDTASEDTETESYDPSTASVLAETDYEGWHLAFLDDAVTGENTDGEDCLSVTLEITNNTGEDAQHTGATGVVYLGDTGTLDLTATQDDTELDGILSGEFDDTSTLSERADANLEDNGSNLDDGESIDIPVFFTLDGDSETTIQIGDDDTTILEATYNE